MPAAAVPIPTHAGMLAADLATLPRLGLLGESRHASVYCVEFPPGGPTYALKVFTERSTARGHRRAWLEAGIHEYLSSCNSGLVAHLAHHQAPIVAGGQHMLLMEYGQDGTLHHLIASRRNWMPLLGQPMFSISGLQDLVGTLITFLRFLQLSHVIHQDLKLGNIIVDSEGRYKMIDFGASTFDGTGSWPGSGIHTAGYEGPEAVQNGALIQCLVGPAYDVYSAGAIALQAVVGVMSASQLQHLQRDISTHGRLPVSLDGQLPLHLSSLIHGLMNRNPWARTQTVWSAHEHAFFQGFDWGRPLPQATGAPALHTAIEFIEFHRPTLSSIEAAEAAAAALSHFHANAVAHAKQMITAFGVPAWHWERRDGQP